MKPFDLFLFHIIVQFIGFDSLWLFETLQMNEYDES